MYSNDVYIPQEPYRPKGTAITRVPHKMFRFSCSIPAKSVKAVTINPSYIQSGIIEEFTGRASFLDDIKEASFELFRDGNYETAVSGSSQPVDASFGTRLYFQVRAVSSCGSACEVYLQSCWGGTSENPYGWPRHQLIEEG